MPNGRPRRVKPTGFDRAKRLALLLALALLLVLLPRCQWWPLC